MSSFYFALGLVSLVGNSVWTWLISVCLAWAVYSVIVSEEGVFCLSSMYVGV